MSIETFPALRRETPSKDRLTRSIEQWWWASYFMLNKCSGEDRRTVERLMGCEVP